MKKAAVLIFLLFSAASLLAQPKAQFRSKFGFAVGEDRIQTSEVLERQGKVVLFGSKNIQVWDIASAKLITSFPNNSYSPTLMGIFRLVTSNITDLTAWRPYAVERDGKWVAIVEKAPDKGFRSVNIIDLSNGRSLARLSLDGMSVDELMYDDYSNELIISGIADKRAHLTVWDAVTFKQKSDIAVDQFKLSLYIRDRSKLILGTGETKIDWTGPNMKNGGQLVMVDAKTGKTEREFTADGLKPRTFYTDTTVSGDERFLFSRREGRNFVWEIDGDGKPKFEITAPDPRQSFSYRSLVAGRFLVFSNGKSKVIYDIEGDGKPMRIYRSAALNDTVYLSLPTADLKYVLASDDNSLSLYEFDKYDKPITRIEQQSEFERFYDQCFWGNDHFKFSRINNKEKRPSITEIYDISGKLVQTLPTTVDCDSEISNDGNLILTRQWDRVRLWNYKEAREFVLRLKTYTSSEGGSGSAEYVQVSPDFSMLLKWGDQFVSLYRADDLEPIQTLIDKDTAKYTKENILKNSGIRTAKFSFDGTKIFTQDNDGRTFAVWDIKK